MHPEAGEAIGQDCWLWGEVPPKVLSGYLRVWLSPSTIPPPASLTSGNLGSLFFFFTILALWS